MTNAPVIKKLLARFASSKLGFTMIELLVVIAIIGILAVAVMSTLNPIEQINKSRDTSVRGDAAQLTDAAERYFAGAEKYPWNEGTATYGTNGTDTVYTGAFYFNASATGADWDWLDALETGGEIKPSFEARLRTQTTMRVIKAAGANNGVYTCFYPVSLTFRAEADRYCQTNGAIVNAASGATICATTNGNAPTTAGTNAICIP